MIRFREISLEGGEIRIRPLREDMGAAMALVRKHRDRVYDLEIKEHREKRSLDANAKFWALCGELSAAVRVPAKEIYQQYIRDIGGNYEIVPVKEDHIKDWNRVWCSGHEGRQTEDMGPCRSLHGYHNIKSYISSSDYDSKQMSRLLDLLIQDCKQVGIETLSEREKSLLIDDWGENYG